MISSYLSKISSSYICKQILLTGGHIYRESPSGPVISPNVTASQLGSILDVTAYSSIDEKAEKMMSHIEELYSTGSTDFTINGVKSTYNNLNDLALALNDISDISKIHRLAKNVGIAKKGDFVHKIMEGLVKGNISRDELTVNGLRNNEFLKSFIGSYESGMQNIWQGGFTYDSLLQGAADNALAMYDIKNKIIASRNQNNLGYAGEAERSFLLSFGEGKNKFDIIKK